MVVSLALRFLQKGLDPDLYLFIDFHSLYQGADRTEEQLRLFNKGLHRMGVLCGHRGACVWVLSTPPGDVAGDPTRGGFEDRGWTTIERLCRLWQRRQAMFWTWATSSWRRQGLG